MGEHSTLTRTEDKAASEICTNDQFFKNSSLQSVGEIGFENQNSFNPNYCAWRENSGGDMDENSHSSSFLILSPSKSEGSEDGSSTSSQDFAREFEGQKGDPDICPIM